MVKGDAGLRSVTTTIRLSPRAWVLLRELAGERAITAGARPSASGVVERLIEAEAARRDAAGRGDA